jgi:tetratricopeptide (TPR) repeat protein
VIINRHLWGGAPIREIELLFCFGKSVAIKEPLVEMDADGRNVIRLTDMFDSIRVEGIKTDRQSNDTERIEMTRTEGNQLFNQQNWAGALEKYTKCVDQALAILENSASSGAASQNKLKSTLLLAYSNRAEARLRLEHYEAALSDAEVALRFDPKHVKTLVRRGKAAQGLGIYDKACEAFKAALEEAPEQDSVLHDLLKASTAALTQSRTLKYDLTAYYLGETLEVPSFADFLGPVEIRPADYAGGGRGLFATRKIVAGELVLVSNPLATVKYKVPPLSSPLGNEEFETITFVTAHP